MMELAVCEGNLGAWAPTFWYIEKAESADQDFYSPPQRAGNRSSQCTMVLWSRMERAPGP